MIEQVDHTRARESIDRSDKEADNDEDKQPDRNYWMLKDQAFAGRKLTWLMLQNGGAE